MAREDSRQRMLTTTAKLLQRQGYHGTGLNQVAADAQAPKGSMYFHFPGGKPQLAAEAISASAAYVDRALVEHEGTTARESLDCYLADVAAILEHTDFADGCPIATVALEVAPAVPQIGDACADAYDRLLQRVTGWLERDGFDSASARDHAFLVYAAIEGALVFAKAHRSTEPIQRLRSQLVNLLPAAPGSTRRRRGARSSPPVDMAVTPG